MHRKSLTEPGNLIKLKRLFGGIGDGRRSLKFTGHRTGKEGAAER